MWHRGKALFRQWSRRRHRIASTHDSTRLCVAGRTNNQIGLTPNSPTANDETKSNRGYCGPELELLANLFKATVRAFLIGILSGIGSAVSSLQGSRTSRYIQQ